MKRIQICLNYVIFFKKFYVAVQNWRHLKHSGQTQGCRMITYYSVLYFNKIICLKNHFCSHQKLVKVSVIAHNTQTQVCTCLHFCQLPVTIFRKVGCIVKQDEFPVSEVKVLLLLLLLFIYLFILFTVGWHNKFFSEIKFRRSLQDLEDFILVPC